MDDIKQDGWKSRKFWVSNSSAFALLAYSMVAKAQGWISEETLMYLSTAALVAVATYCGFNLGEKLGLIKITLTKGLAKMLPAGPKNVSAK